MNVFVGIRRGQGFVLHCLVHVTFPHASFSEYILVHQHLSCGLQHIIPHPVLVSTFYHLSISYSFLNVILLSSIVEIILLFILLFLEDVTHLKI